MNVLKKNILCSGKNLEVDLDPLTRKIYLELQPPDTQNNQGVAERIKDGVLKLTHGGQLEIPLGLLQRLYRVCKKGEWKVTVTLSNDRCGGQLINIEPGYKLSCHWGLALDIGTTTLVAYLVDMNNGKIKDTATGYNQQAEFGEDILTRLQLAEQKDQLSSLHRALLISVNSLIEKLIIKNNLQKEDISAASIAGNTAMVHFCLGVDPSGLCHNPYLPTFNDPGIIQAKALDLQINPYGVVYCLPNIGSYVGGDVVAGILVSELHKKNEVSVLVDIGTNGEIILGNRDWMVACAGAAGPALEGGVVEAAMRAEKGAIKQVKIDPKTKKVEYKTIGNTRPKGICGSGLIDCIAELLLNGITDRRGNFSWNTSNFILVPAEETAHGQDIIITQKDIKNLIRTKGAVNTALEVLLEGVGCNHEEITYFYAAGAFGTYINPESAVTIGLFPDLPREKIVRIGNSSVEGARLALLSQKKREEIHGLAQKISYFELNNNQEFMNKFNSGQFLPHTDIDAYPTVKEKLKTMAQYYRRNAGS